MTPFTREITERVQHVREGLLPPLMDFSPLLDPIEEEPRPRPPRPPRPRTVVEERVEGRGGAAIGAILAALAFLVLASYLD